MGETPSKRRRKGREAFIPYEDPMDHQPYKKGSFKYDFHLPDWLEGWEGEKKEYELTEAENNDWETVCPCCGSRKNST